MLYAKFIQLVENNAERLTKQWINEVRNNPATPGYKKMSDEILSSRVFNVYQRLGTWISLNDPSDIKTGEHYVKLGRERASEGLKLSEVTYAFLLSRVVLWKFILSQGIIDNFFDLQQAFEFFQKVNNFYDKAIYLVAVGYESYTSISEAELKKSGVIEKSLSAVTNWLIK